MQAKSICTPRLIRSFVAMVLGACLASLVAAQPLIAAFSVAPVGGPPATWKFASLPNKVPTKFSIVELAGARVLKVESDASYGNLVHDVQAPMSPRSQLTWRWRVDKLLDSADLKTRAGDDSPAKLCVLFAFDATKLSFGERTKLALAHTTTGQDVPSETLCYVWDNKLPVNSGVVNAFTKRIRYIVLQSGVEKLGQWVTQRRNVVADYQRMFGDESEGKAADVIGVAVSADSDNTREHGLAYFGDVLLAP